MRPADRRLWRVHSDEPSKGDRWSRWRWLASDALVVETNDFAVWSYDVVDEHIGSWLTPAPRSKSFGLQIRQYRSVGVPTRYSGMAAAGDGADCTDGGGRSVEEIVRCGVTTRDVGGLLGGFRCCRCRARRRRWGRVVSGGATRCGETDEGDQAAGPPEDASSPLARLPEFHGYRMPALGRLCDPRAVRIGRLSGCSGDEGCDDVGGVSVEGDAGAVVAHGGPRVGVAGRFLDVA